MSNLNKFKAISLSLSPDTSLPDIKINFENVVENYDKKIKIVLSTTSLSQNNFTKEYIHTLQQINDIIISNAQYAIYSLKIISLEDSNINSKVTIKTNDSEKIFDEISTDSEKEVIINNSQSKQTIGRFGFGGLMSAGSFTMVSSGF